jgi:hypothetical protein
MISSATNLMMDQRVKMDNEYWWAIFLAVMVALILLTVPYLAFGG